MASYKNFTELDCYKKCRSVRIWVEELIKTKIPKHDFDMIQNIRRAGRSTTRNIAEGFGRHHFKENIQYLRISRGSLYEIEEDFIISLDHNYIDQQELSKGKELTQAAIYSINGFIKYLSK